jgi:hypothetical protein
MNICFLDQHTLVLNRFKLMHTYDDPDYAVWHMPTAYESSDDDISVGNRCAQQFLKGEFKVSG